MIRSGFTAVFDTALVRLAVGPRSAGGGGAGSAAAVGADPPDGRGEVDSTGGVTESVGEGRETDSSTTTPWPAIRASTVCCFRTASRRERSAVIQPAIAAIST